MMIQNGNFPGELNYLIFLFQKIMEAAISNTCGKLAAISIAQQSNTQDAMKGPVVVHLWDLNNHTNWKVVLSEHPSTCRQLMVGCEYLVTFLQTRKKASDVERLIKDLQSRSANGAHSLVEEAVIHIIDKRGSTREAFQIPGKFSGVSGTSSESTLKNISEGLVAYGVQEGVVKTRGVKSNNALGTFTVNNTEITAVNFSSSGRSAVVGCANGNVHVIQMI